MDLDNFMSVDLDSFLKQIPNVVSYSYKELANRFSTSPASIARAFKRIGIKKEGRVRKGKSVNISELQHQIILGSILGDGTVSKHYFCERSRKQINSQLRISHSVKQLEYLKFKKEFLDDISTEIYIKDTTSGFDDKLYKTCFLNSIKCITFNTYRDNFYPFGKKIIPKSIQEIEAPALAIWFQDDGSWCSSSIKLATMCFTVEELYILKDLLYNKFKLDFSISKDRTLYLRKYCLQRFKEIVIPYMHSSLMYKFAVRGKLGELLEKPEVVNQQPS